MTVGKSVAAAPVAAINGSATHGGVPHPWQAQGLPLRQGRFIAGFTLGAVKG